MSKLAKMGARPVLRSPVRSTGDTTTTHEGGIGHVRDPKSELFLLAASNLVAEDTFYEGKDTRDERYRALVRRVTADDPEWVRGFARYLRDDLRMRSASVVMACEYVAAGGPQGRSVIASVCQRPDEPAEVLGYWFATYGRKLPAAVKRGVADAAQRLYSETALLKYDGKGQPIRFADVIDLTHPQPKDARQSALFRFALDRRHNRENPRTEGLPDIITDQKMWAVPQDRRSLDTFEGKVTWERFSSWIGRKLTGAEWDFLVPKMGLMAVVRNLRNMDEAGISPETEALINARLADPEDVARSRQLPFRFYTTWREVRSLRWGPGLERAITASLANVPELKGRTLILIDDSGSMSQTLSGRSTVPWNELAKVFGAALALRAEAADVFVYSNNAVPVTVCKGDSLLRTVEGFPHLGGGTETIGVLATTYSLHDRVVIVTDEQAFGETWRGGFSMASARHDSVDRITAPVYTFNLAGYRAGHLPSGTGNRHTFGGLSDAAFTLLGVLEAGKDGTWPWE